MRCAIIEVDTRDEVMQEMEERMQNMEKMYRRRLMKEVTLNSRLPYSSCIKLRPTDRAE